MAKTTKSYSGMDRQREVYLTGAAGIMPKVPVDYKQLKALAAKNMRPEAFAYVAAGAGNETTVSENRRAFGKWRIVPRMLRDVSSRDTSVELFGQKFPSPIMLAPIGVLDLAHPKAGMAVAAAAAQNGTPMIISSQASEPMEDCAAVLGNTPHWYQLYWSKSRELAASFVRRAEACNCSAIVVTLDTTILGWRTRDLDCAYLPFLRGMGIAQYVSDPVFQRLLDEDPEGNPPDRKVTFAAIKMLLQLNRNYPGGLLTNLKSGRALKAVRKFIDIYSNPALNWDDLSFLREHTKLPILLKGILHADDAKKALDYGMDGIIVSNHGGRQVDGAIGAVRALPDVAKAVQRRVPILMDSGIRGGADIFKALALGANAVCLGRPYTFGLAIAGQAGVSEVIRNYMADFDLTMGLAGCTKVSEIKEDCLVGSY